MNTPNPNPNTQNAPPKDGMVGDSAIINNQNMGGNDISSELNTLSRRIRMIEERYYNVRKKTQLTDQNMLEDNKKITTHLKYFTKEIKELKKKVTSINEKLEMFDEELHDTAKKRDITLITKYLDFWEPMQFMTEKDAIKMISDTLDHVGLKKK